MEFESALRGGAGVLAAIGGLFGVTFLLAGPWLLAQIYGAAYAGAGAFIGWLGAMQAVRLMRVAPTQGSIAHGDTRTSMIANAWRMSALGLSIPVAIAGADVLLIAAAGCAGECAAFVVTVVRLQRRQGVPWTVCGEPAALAMAVIGLFALGRLAGTPPTALVFATALAAAVTMIAWRWRRRGLDGSPRDRIGPTRVALGVSSDD